MTTYGHDDGHNKIVVPSWDTYHALDQQVDGLATRVTNLENEYQGVSYSYASWHPLDVAAEVGSENTQGIVIAGSIRATVNAAYRTIQLHGTSEILQNSLYTNPTHINFPYWGINLNTLFNAEHLNIPEAYPDPTGHPEWNWKAVLPTFPNTSDQNLTDFGGAVRYYVSGWAKNFDNPDDVHRPVISEYDTRYAEGNQFGVREWSCYYNMSGGVFKQVQQLRDGAIVNWLVPARVFSNDNVPGAYPFYIDDMMPNVVLDWEVTLGIIKPREDGGVS